MFLPEVDFRIIVNPLRYSTLRQAHLPWRQASMKQMHLVSKSTHTKRTRTSDSGHRWKTVSPLELKVVVLNFSNIARVLLFSSLHCRQVRKRQLLRFVRRVWWTRWSSSLRPLRRKNADRSQKRAVKEAHWFSLASLKYFLKGKQLLFLLLLDL